MRWFGASKAKSKPVAYGSSPLLAVKTPRWRSNFVLVLLGLGSCLLIGKAAYIQIIENDFYRAEGDKRYVHALAMSANRGRIVDRNGRLLALSVPTPSVWAIPNDFDADAAQREQLAKLLGLSVADLDRRLLENPKFVWLRRQVEDSQWADVKALGLKGVHAMREYKRSYPEADAAAHVVGFTNIEQKGQEGIELAFQNELQGRDGLRTVVKNRLGAVVEDVGVQVEPRNGREIVLTLDSKIQSFAYQRAKDAVAEHRAKAASVVVLDVQRGEVLALANYPSFDPASRATLSGAQLRNRVLTDTFEPGSTMKPFIAAWAIESKRVKPETMIQTAPGQIQIGSHVIRDAHPQGLISVAQVIQKSSNVGTVKMAMQMRPQEMWELYSNVGFGHKPQIHFPGAVSGRLRPPETWRPIEQATMSYGYGLSASLFQLAHAYAVLAHDGLWTPMTLVKQEAPAQSVRVLSSETAAAVREMLRLAAGPGGTAPKAQTLGYSVGGKTGTAHKQEGKGYATNKYRAWFVGMAPALAPRIVVAVMVDEPTNGKYYGGEVAAPVFSQVVQQSLRALGVAPDVEFSPQILAHQLPAAVESF